MRSPEIGTFNSRPELEPEYLTLTTLSYEELMALVDEHVGNARGRRRASKLSQLEAQLEERGADLETFTHLYEVSGAYDRQACLKQHLSRIALEVE